MSGAGTGRHRWPTPGVGDDDGAGGDDGAGSDSGTEGDTVLPVTGGRR